MKDAPTGDPRIAVIVPCYRDGAYVGEAVASVMDGEPVELVVVDDGSPDEVTAQALQELEREGIRVLRHESNCGAGCARNTGLAATRAPYVFSLDADDMLTPNTLGRLARMLDADPEAVVAYGDYQEFGRSDVLRAVPHAVDPYRIAYTNEYPPAALFRREFLNEVGGWDPYRYKGAYYEDWDLWMKVAERGGRGVHAGTAYVTYRRRLHGVRLLDRAKRHHVPIYRRMRRGHPSLFANLSAHRHRSDISPVRKLLYPVVYGARPRVAAEAKLKGMLDQIGIWTMRR
jgi:glycosyltransferase involved in cell wall biosynthesis